MIRPVLVALSMLIAGQAVAQVEDIPPELLNNTRRLQGEEITVCFDSSGQSRLFDRDVAQAIGDALFLKVNFEEGFGQYPIDGGGFMGAMLLALTNTCDMFMGISVQSNTQFPDWASVSRPYATIPFVVAATNPDWQKLGDIPKDRKLGTALQSLGEMVFITWQQQQPEAQRWVRLPYADPSLMARRVEDGTLGAMLLWQPTLAGLQRNAPEAIANMHIIASDPVPQASVRIGALLSSRDSFLKNQVDQAIDALVADGTIAALLEKHGYVGNAGE